MLENVAVNIVITFIGSFNDDIFVSVFIVSKTTCCYVATRIIS